MWQWGSWCVSWGFLWASRTSAMRHRPLVGRPQVGGAAAPVPLELDGLVPLELEHPACKVCWVSLETILKSHKMKHHLMEHFTELIKCLKLIKQT